MKKFQLGQSRENVINLFPEKAIRRVKLGEKEIGIVRIGEIFFAFDSLCPHRGASLIQGSINGYEEIICPLHQYRFDLKTGALHSGSCSDLEVYQTNLTDEGLIIQLNSGN
ncbi:Rieske (2Fe-2S) protein [Algoriphagus marincola]|uniref:Rieske (2Fe-2S) protein n=1 Tax=Algoriphagus marincola TaxID=264027 RepID=UPI00042151C4|nr:Rieske (2Fe-2S) protein [Algoriphagus marincola]